MGKIEEIHNRLLLHGFDGQNDCAVHCDSLESSGNNLHKWHIMIQEYSLHIDIHQVM